jgi:hypothetical protein
MDAAVQVHRRNGTTQGVQLMRITLIGAAASALMVSTSVIALAQTPSVGEPAGKMQAPGAQGPATHQPGGKAEGQPQGQAPGANKGMRESQGVPPGAKGAQGPAETPNKGRDQPKSSQTQPEKAQPKRTESEHEKSQPKSSQTQPEKSQPKSSQTQPEKGQPKSSQTQPEKGQQKAGEAPRDNGQKNTQRQQPGNEHRVQVSEQQRSGVRERLFKEGKFEKTKLGVRVNVGSRVPRSVRLLPLPVFILDTAPSYRGYSYIVLEDDTIYIVDPRTYDVVDVIDGGSQRAEQSHRSLSLSQAQMRFIYAGVPKEPRENVRVRLALGAEVPRDVELLAFPSEIISAMPDLEGYRYVVAENDIVVVDPRDRGVVLVITD